MQEEEEEEETEEVEDEEDEEEQPIKKKKSKKGTKNAPAPQNEIITLLTDTRVLLIVAALVGFFLY